MFGFGSYYLAKLLRKGPDPVEDALPRRRLRRSARRKPKRPLSVPDESLEGRSRAARRSRPSRRATCRCPRLASRTEYEGLAFWLPLIWAGLLAIAVAMYVIADGFDLGVGILFNAAHAENWRDRMMLSVAPVWDGNETWLILGGGGLLAVFYLAYAILMPALYIPILIMLIALIFRGVAFEFRFKADTLEAHLGLCLPLRLARSRPSRKAWCSGPSCRASTSRDGSSPAATLDWLTPFSLMTGVGLVTAATACSARPGA